MFKDNPLKIEKALPRSKGKSEGSEQPVSAGGGASNSAGSRRKGGSKSSKRSSSAAESDSVQPDPRWAQELEKLKELLATQTASS